MNKDLQQKFYLAFIGENDEDVSTELKDYYQNANEGEWMVEESTLPESALMVAGGMRATSIGLFSDLESVLDPFDLTSVSGASEVIYGVQDRLEEAGFNVHLCLLDIEKPLSESLDDDGYTDPSYFLNILVSHNDMPGEMTLFTAEEIKNSRFLSLDLLKIHAIEYDEEFKEAVILEQVAQSLRAVSSSEHLPSFLAFFKAVASHGVSISQLINNNASWLPDGLMFFADSMSYASTDKSDDIVMPVDARITSDVTWQLDNEGNTILLSFDTVEGPMEIVIDKDNPDQSREPNEIQRLLPISALIFNINKRYNNSGQVSGKIVRSNPTLKPLKIISP